MTDATIYSRRHDAARGFHTVAERQCAATDAASWLNVFRRDEPDVAFAAGVTGRRPPHDWTFRKLGEAE